MKKIKILAEFIDKNNIECVSISKVDYDYLYEMSELLMNIQDDIFNIRSILEQRRNIGVIKENNKS